MNRGDVLLVNYPLVAGTGGSRRPALVIQSNVYNQLIENTLVAQITTNLLRTSDPAHLLIEIATPEGHRSGLLHDSLVSCTNLATLDPSRIDRVIGSLSSAAMRRIDDCLKTALGLT